MARPKLGRGIASLLSPLEQHIQHISIDLITLTPVQEQEKENFSIAELELLAGEIDIAGISTPFSVRKEGASYTLLGNLKTYCAAKMVATIVPILLPRTVSTQQKDPILMMLEQGEGNPITLAQTYSSIMLQFQLTQEQLSKKIKRSRPSIANTLRLLNLPFDIRNDIQEGRLCSGHGLALLRLPKREQRILYLKIKEENLTIAQATEYAQKKQDQLQQSSELDELIQKKSEAYRAPFKAYAKGTAVRIEFTSRDELMAFLRAI